MAVSTHYLQGLLQPKHLYPFSNNPGLQGHLELVVILFSVSQPQV